MDLVIGFLAGRRADGAVEIVERKGIGHSETASVQINAADGDALESLYLAVTGTSAEVGDVRRQLAALAGMADELSRRAIVIGGWPLRQSAPTDASR